LNIDSILLSDYAAITDGGKLTVIGVFNRIPVTEAPVKIPLLFVSLVIHAHASEAGSSHRVEIAFLNAKREPLRQPLVEEFTFAGPGSIRPGIPLRYVTAIGLLLPEFPELGPYAFEVLVDGTYHAAASLYVGE
jgi:hypothetical protein